MGMLNHDPHIQHFSHPHLLELCNLQHQPQALNAVPCSGCKLQPSGYMYACRPCNFTLHLSCSQFPELISHPSHPNHSLTLLPTSAYSGGLFNCDACNHPGDGFSYHCIHCDFDLHVVCASKPLSITHQVHPHTLTLTFCPPYEIKAFSCDVCYKMGYKQWLYRCSACEFDVHLECATATHRPLVQPQPVLEHQYRSFPNATYGQLQAPVARPNYYMHSAGTGAQQSYHPSAINGSTNGNALMGAAIQGFIDGAAQQVGQNFMQSIMGDGSTGGGGDGTSYSSSASIIGVGSSLLSSVFGNSASQN